MSSTIHYAAVSLIDQAGRFLEKRWVQALLFAGVFIAAWLIGPRVAHAALA
jgi:hypothetical protein